MAANAAEVSKILNRCPPTRSVGHTEQTHPGDGGDVDDDPNPLRHIGKERVQVAADNERVDQGQQQIVQQRRPADQETEIGADGLGGVGVSRSRRGKDPRHPAVADGGEHHDHQGQQVGGRNDMAGLLRHDPEGVEHHGRRHVAEAEAHDRPQAEGPGELGGSRRPAGDLGHRRPAFIAAAPKIANSLRTTPGGGLGPVWGTRRE